MAKKILKYGVMLGTFAPIMRKDFDIAKRVMNLKGLDGIVFVPTSYDGGSYGVSLDDKYTLIKLAAQDYVNLVKEDIAFMVSECAIRKNMKTFKEIMSAVREEVSETNKHHPDFYIEHIAIRDIGAITFDLSSYDEDMIVYTLKGNKSEFVLDLTDIQNKEIDIYKLHDMISKNKDIPEEVWVGKNHKNFYLNMCIKK